MFTTLMQTLLVGLQLWQHKEANKYHDRAMSLKRRYRDEFNKPEGERSDAVIDDLEFELRILADSFSAAAQIANS